MTSTPSPGSHPHTDPDRDDRHIDPGADRCPECGGYAQRGCGAAWHDGKPDTHCSPACQCRADIKADLRYWHDQAVTQEARAAEAVADRDRLAARVETLEGAIRLAERALRDQPMQAFRTAEAQRRRAAAIDALRALVAPDTPTSPTDTGDPT